MMFAPPSTNSNSSAASAISTIHGFRRSGLPEIERVPPRKIGVDEFKERHVVRLERAQPALRLDARDHRPVHGRDVAWPDQLAGHADARRLRHAVGLNLQVERDAPSRASGQRRPGAGDELAARVGKKCKSSGHLEPYSCAAAM